jgi:hypothetical protein
VVVGVDDAGTVTVETVDVTTVTGAGTCWRMTCGAGACLNMTTPAARTRTAEAMTTAA